MGELPTRRHGIDTAQEQAAYFAARERRRSLAGVVELFRTHRFLNAARTLTLTDATNATPIVVTSAAHGLVTGMTVAITGVLGNTAANGTWVVTVLTADTFSLDTSVGNGAYVSGGEAVVTPNMPVPLIDTDAVFPSRGGLITFQTAIRITGAAPVGLVFEFGSSTRGCGVALSNQFASLTAGGATTERAIATYDNTVALPIGLEMDLVGAIRPGSGEIRLWGNGREIARDTAAAGNFGGDWADTEDGSFASIAAGTAPSAFAAVNQAPVDFEVIEPLSVYIGSVPQHFPG